MATDSQLLALNDTAIEGLYAAMADELMESYTTPDGRTYQRAQFSATLKTLLEAREILKAAIRSSSRNTSRVRVAKLGFAGRSR